MLAQCPGLLVHFEPRPVELPYNPLGYGLRISAPSDQHPERVTLREVMEAYLNRQAEAKQQG